MTERNGEPEDYYTLYHVTSHYEVQPGDCLWTIAENHYGDGRKWTDIRQENSDVVGDGELIFAGSKLILPEAKFYIPKQEDSLGGLSEPAYSFDMPDSWLYGTTDTDICLNSFWPSDEREDSQLWVHVAENRQFPGSPGSVYPQWEEMKDRIRESAAITEDSGLIQFSEPEFSHYSKEDGSELVFYTFVAESGGMQTKYAVAYVAGQYQLAEFIGEQPLSDKERSDSGDIGELVRYVASSFTETGEERSVRMLKYEPYLGSESWSYEYLHNPFAIALNRAYPYGNEEAMLTGEDKEVGFSSPEWEGLVRGMVYYHKDMYHLSEEEQDAFFERPLRLSDLAWITEVELSDSLIEGRDTIRFNGIVADGLECADYSPATLKDIVVFPNLKSLSLDIGGVSDYEALAGCASLEELSLAYEFRPDTTDWLKELPSLKRLVIAESAFAQYVKSYPDLAGEETTFGIQQNKDEIPEEEYVALLSDSLKQCKNLSYLYLEHDGALDLGFLDELPNLYSFLLYPTQGEDGESSLEMEGIHISDSDYPQIKCLALDGEWIRNPE